MKNDTQDHQKIQHKQEKDTTEKDSFKEILSFIETTDLEYVEILKNGNKISLRRSIEQIAVTKPSSPSANEKTEAVPQFFIIRSPIVGRFHSSTGPDRPALVVESAKITAGQRVAIVEAMKIKKEVFSAVAGKVIRIFVRDGDPVEYGQELFSVEPEQEISNE